MSMCVRFGVWMSIGRLHHEIQTAPAAHRPKPQPAHNRPVPLPTTSQPDATTPHHHHHHAPRMPSDVLPCCAALSAYSICRSLPVREKVVSEKLYAASPPDMVRFQTTLAGWLGVCVDVFVMDGMDVIEGWVIRSVRCVGVGGFRGQSIEELLTGEARKFGRVVGLSVDACWWTASHGSEPLHMYGTGRTRALPLVANKSRRLA